MRKLQHYGKPCGYAEVWRLKNIAETITSISILFSEQDFKRYLDFTANTRGTLETVAIWRIYEKPKPLRGSF